MKRLFELWREFVCLCLFSVILYSTVYWATEPPDTDFGQFVFIVLFFSEIALLWYLLKCLWRQKWRQKVRALVKELLQRTARLVLRVFKRLNLLSQSGKNVIGGSTRIMFDDDIATQNERRRPKKLKWKSLQSDRERLGFLYRLVISRKIKNGMYARATDTPLELSRRSENTEPEQEVFDLYVSTRYDERVSLSEEMIASLKDKFEKSDAVK